MSCYTSLNKAKSSNQVSLPETVQLLDTNRAKVKLKVQRWFGVTVPVIDDADTSFSVRRDLQSFIHLCINGGSGIVMELICIALYLLFKSFLHHHSWGNEVYCRVLLQHT